MISKGSTIHLWKCSRERRNEEKVLQNFWITSPYCSQTLGTGQKTPMKSKHLATKSLWFSTVAFQSQSGQGETGTQAAVKVLGNKGK